MSTAPRVNVELRDYQRDPIAALDLAVWALGDLEHEDLSDRVHDLLLDVDRVLHSRTMLGKIG